MKILAGIHSMIAVHPETSIWTVVQECVDRRHHPHIDTLRTDEVQGMRLAATKTLKLQAN